MCFDDQVLSTYIDGELAEPWKTQVEEHLLHCTICKSRYDQLIDLENDIRAARLRDDEFTVQRERIWQYLEKNCVSTVKEKIFDKRFTVKAPVVFAAAAAFVIIFAAGIFFTARAKNPSIPEIPTISSQQEEGKTQNLIPVVATDASPAARSLQDLTIEEILQLLDARGFEVDLRLKSVERLTVSAPARNSSNLLNGSASSVLKPSAALPVQPDSAPDSSPASGDEAVAGMAEHEAPVDETDAEYVETSEEGDLSVEEDVTSADAGMENDIQQSDDASAGESEPDGNAAAAAGESEADDADVQGESVSKDGDMTAEQEAAAEEPEGE